MIQNSISQDGVNIAFSLILGELENVILDLTEEGTLAFQQRQYDEAVRLSKAGTELEAFQVKVRELQQQWIQSFDPTTRDRAQIERMPEINAGKRNPKTILKVTFPDGRVICEPIAAQTFVRVLVEFGLDKVKALGQIVNRFQLISHKRSDVYHQVREGGYYVMTHSSTDQKKRLLEEAARKLNIKVKVEIVG